MSKNYTGQPNFTKIWSRMLKELKGFCSSGYGWFWVAIKQFLKMMKKTHFCCFWCNFWPYFLLLSFDISPLFCFLILSHPIAIGKHIKSFLKKKKPNWSYSTICDLPPCSFWGFSKTKNIHNLFGKASIISSLKQNMFIMFRLKSGPIFTNIDKLV